MWHRRIFSAEENQISIHKLSNDAGIRLSNGYRETTLRGQCGRGVRLARDVYFISKLAYIACSFYVLLKQRFLTPNDKKWTFPTNGSGKQFLWNAQDHNPSGSQRSIIGVVTRLRSGGSRQDVFPSPKRPNRLWGAPSLIFNVYRRPLPQVHRGRGVRLTTHPHLGTRQKMGGATPRRIACCVA